MRHTNSIKYEIELLSERLSAYLGHALSVGIKSKEVEKKFDYADFVARRKLVCTQGLDGNNSLGPISEIFADAVEECDSGVAKLEAKCDYELLCNL